MAYFGRVLHAFRVMAQAIHVRSLYPSLLQMRRQVTDLFLPPPPVELRGWRWWIRSHVNSVRKYSFPSAASCLTDILDWLRCNTAIATVAPLIFL